MWINDCEKTCEAVIRLQEQMGERIKRVDLRFELMDTALILKTNELEKRLEGLNQLRADVVKDRELFVKQDVYDFKTRFYDDWCTGVNNKLTTLDTRMLTVGGGIAAVLVVVEILLRIVK